MILFQHIIVILFLCTDRATIYFECHVQKKRKCSLENALVEKSEIILIMKVNVINYVTYENMLTIEIVNVEKN